MGEENRVLQGKSPRREHLLNNPLHFTDSRIHLLSRDKLKIKEICGVGMRRPLHWKLLSPSMLKNKKKSMLEFTSLT